MKPLKWNELLAIFAGVLIAVVSLTILRAHPPLQTICEFIEGNWPWGHSAIIGLQSGLGAAAGTVALHIHQKRRRQDSESKP